VPDPVPVERGFVESGFGVMGGPARDLRTAKFGPTNARAHRRRLPRSSANSGSTDLLQIRCPKAGEVYHHSVIGAKGRGHALPSVFRWKFLYPTGVRCGTSSAHNPTAMRMATTCQQRASGPGFSLPVVPIRGPNCGAVIARAAEPTTPAGMRCRRGQWSQAGVWPKRQHASAYATRDAASRLWNRRVVW